MRTRGGFGMRGWSGPVLALALAAAGPAQAIINGVVDTTTGAVGAVTDGVTAMDTAVLIDPWWVLTSASFATAVGDGWFAVGSDYAAPVATCPFSAIFPHPSYDPDTGAHDIALIRLAAPATGVTPIPYATTALPAAGAGVRYVGFGATSTDNFDNTVRRACDNPVSYLSAYTFVTEYNGAGPYLGDGGAPALVMVDGAWRVAGIVSQVAWDGVSTTIATRVSTYASFIAAVMAANPPVSAVPAPAELQRRLDAAPNPFNPRTELVFELDRAGPCRLAVFDLKGREVAVLLDGGLEVGRHAAAWNGYDAAGRAVASGTYLVVLRAPDGMRTGKVTLAK